MNQATREVPGEHYRSNHWRSERRRLSSRRRARAGVRATPKKHARAPAMRPELPSYRRTRPSRARTARSSRRTRSRRTRSPARRETSRVTFLMGPFRVRGLLPNQATSPRSVRFAAPWSRLACEGESTGGQVTAGGARPRRRSGARSVSSSCGQTCARARHRRRRGVPSRRGGGARGSTARRPRL